MGALITFEGGEGAGKSTLMERLKIALSGQGYVVVLTREPGGTPLGEKIREILLNPQLSINPLSECLLFLASRAQQIEEQIRPALARGDIVLCDRFNDSTIAYQGIARALGYEYVTTLCHLVCGDLVPELTLFLDIDPQIGLQRAENSANTPQDRIERESLHYHQKVREGFHKIARQNSKRLHIIDATQPKAEVFEQAYRLIQKRLKGGPDV